MKSKKNIGYAIAVTLASVGTSLIAWYHYHDGIVRAKVQTAGWVPSTNISALGQIHKRLDRTRQRYVDDLLNYENVYFIIETSQGKLEDTIDSSVCDRVIPGETYDFTLDHWLNPLFGKNLRVIWATKVEN